jgi:hypothetical protein
VCAMRVPVRRGALPAVSTQGNGVPVASNRGSTRSRALRMRSRSGGKAQTLRSLPRTRPAACRPKGSEMTPSRARRLETAAPAPRGVLRGVTYVDPRPQEALELERWRREQRRLRLDLQFSTKQHQERATTHE